MRSVHKAALIGLGLAHAVAGLMLIATLTPGGVTLGLLLLGVGAALYLVWMAVRVLLQLRELLMLLVARERADLQRDDESSLPACGVAPAVDRTSLHADP